MPAAGAKVLIRDKILLEATRHFAARGFEGTTVQDIADAVGIRKPSLLYHFPSKEELRQAVLEGMLEHWNRALPGLLAAASSGEGQFEAVVGELLGFFTADPDRARLVVREILDRPTEVKRLLATAIRPWIDVVADHIRRGQSQGRIRPDVDPEAYVVHIINLVLSGVATHHSLGVVSDERQQRELIRLAKSGLFLHESSEPTRGAET